MWKSHIKLPAVTPRQGIVAKTGRNCSGLTKRFCQDNEKDHQQATSHECLQLRNNLVMGKIDWFPDSVLAALQDTSALLRDHGTKQGAKRVSLVGV